MPRLGDGKQCPYCSFGVATVMDSDHNQGLFWYCFSCHYGWEIDQDEGKGNHEEN